MITFLFSLGIILSGSTSVVFLFNFLRPPQRMAFHEVTPGFWQPKWVATRRGHPASLVCAFHSLGWAVALTKYMGWGQRWFTTPLIAASLPLSLLGLLILLNARRQRDLR